MQYGECMIKEVNHSGYENASPLGKGFEFTSGGGVAGSGNPFSRLRRQTTEDER